MAVNDEYMTVEALINILLTKPLGAIVTMDIVYQLDSLDNDILELLVDDEVIMEG